jgi:hypothetical protein
MRPLTMRLLVSAFLVSLAVPAFAVTYLVPSDREMIQRADDIVVVTSVTSTVERTARGGIVTRYILRIEDVLKGERSRGSYLRLTEIGGELGGMTFYASGMPIYVPGRQYLVFTDANAEGEPMTWGLELGQFTLDRDFALRTTDGGIDQNNFEAYHERARDARGFMNYIRGIVAQRIDPNPTYFVSAPRLQETGISAQTFTRASYLVFSAPRWQTAPNASVRTALAPTGGASGVSAVNSAIAAWNATPGNIAYSYFGQDDTAINGFSHCGTTPCGFDAYDSKNTVLFNDPNGEVNPPVLGRGGYWSTGATYQVGGETFIAIDGGIDVVIDNVSFSQTLLNQVVLHELGHTFGFRHSNQNPDGSGCNSAVNDCTTQAMMNSSVGAFTTLQTWDRAAVSVTYGVGPTCTPASISNQPQDKSIVSGQPANVTVTAAGDTPLTYQWFIGASNTDTSNPVAGQTTATLTHAPTSTTSYWARVNGCNSSSVASRVVTVTVTACTPPSINSQPQGTTIASGNSAMLTVGAAGSGPFSYQWYVGTPQDTSSPIGTNTSSILVFPTATTTYWVRVTGQCAPVANSTASTVTVTGSTCPDITIAPPTANQQSNGTYNLTVNASSQGRPLTYQWFQGSVPGSGTLLNTGQTVNVPAPTGPVSYWVKVFNDCGKQANSTTVVTISPCELANITTEPADQSIGNGASATLTIAFTSPTNTTVTWYRGVAPDKTNQVGTGTSLNTGPLTTTTQYWATATNTCGEKLTRTATITVDSCTAPQIQSVSPASASTDIGKTVTLIAAATGTATLHYQWYEGASGDTSKPVGTDSATFTSAALTANTKFWVKVSNGCGNVNSSTVNVTVVYPRRHSARS